MPTTSKWSSPTQATAINSDATSPTLKNLSDNNSVESGVLDNSTARAQYMDIEVFFKPQSAFTAASRLEVYLLVAADGTNYTTASQLSLVKSLPTPGTGTSQVRHVLRLLSCPPHKFKVVVINKTGSQLTNTDDENGVRVYTYADEMVLDD